MEALPHPKPPTLRLSRPPRPFADTEGRAPSSPSVPRRGCRQHAAGGRRGPGRGGGGAWRPRGALRHSAPRASGTGITSRLGRDRYSESFPEIRTALPALQPKSNTQGPPPGQWVPSPPRQPGQPRFRPIKSGNETIRQLAPSAGRRRPPSVRLRSRPGTRRAAAPRLPTSVARGGFGDLGSRSVGLGLCGSRGCGRGGGYDLYGPGCCADI